MWEYIVPIIVFLVVYLVVYKLKEEEKNVNIQAVPPALILSVLVFVLIKYRYNFFTYEPVMGGNYFE